MRRDQTHPETWGCFRSSSWGGGGGSWTGSLSIQQVSGSEAFWVGGGTSSSGPEDSGLSQSGKEHHQWSWGGGPPPLEVQVMRGSPSSPTGSGVQHGSLVWSRSEGLVRIRYRDSGGRGFRAWGGGGGGGGVTDPRFRVLVPSAILNLWAARL